MVHPKSRSVYIHPLQKSPYDNSIIYVSYMIACLHSFPYSQVNFAGTNWVKELEQHRVRKNGIRLVGMLRNCEQILLIIRISGTECNNKLLKTERRTTKKMHCIGGYSHHEQALNQLTLLQNASITPHLHTYSQYNTFALHCHFSCFRNFTDMCKHSVMLFVEIL